MSINFSLHKNTLSSEANQYHAVVQASGTIDYDHIVDLVVKQNSTVTRADVLAVLAGQLLYRD
jgi:hypothetical protein